MADEEPKVPPPLFPSLDRGAGPPADSEIDPLQTLHGVWHLLRLALAVTAIAAGPFISSCRTFLAVTSSRRRPSAQQPFRT